MREARSHTGSDQYFASAIVAARETAHKLWFCVGTHLFCTFWPFTAVMDCLLRVITLAWYLISCEISSYHQPHHALPRAHPLTQRSFIQHFQDRPTNYGLNRTKGDICLIFISQNFAHISHLPHASQRQIINKAIDAPHPACLCFN